jgi:hypothetical protein
MMTTTQDKPGGKPRQRNRKTEPRKQKGEPRNGAPRDPQKEEQVRARSASGENPAPEAVSVAAVTPAGIETAAAAEAAAVEAVAAAAETEVAGVEMVSAAKAPLVGELLPPLAAMAEAVDDVSLLTIANAVAEYARNSLQDGNAFIEKFMRVRSFDMAIELQGEFARQACTNFVAESQKIYALYGRWVRQIFRPWEVAAATLSQAGRRF